MILCTQAEYAAHLGVQPAYVAKLKAEGRIVMVGRNKRKKVDKEASDQLMQDTQSLDKQDTVERHAKERQRKQEEEQQTVEEEPEESAPKASSVYHQSRARKEEYAADLLKLSLDKERALLLPIDEVINVIRDGDTIIRNRLETLPDKMAPLLAVENDEQRIRSILIDQIEYMLGDLSQAIKKLEAGNG